MSSMQPDVGDLAMVVQCCHCWPTLSALGKPFGKVVRIDGVDGCMCIVCRCVHLLSQVAVNDVGESYPRAWLMKINPPAGMDAVPVNVKKRKPVQQT